MLRTVSVTGVGTAHATPDMAILSFGVQTVEGAVRSAITNNTNAMVQVQSILEAQGIDPADISTTTYNLYVQEVYQNGRPTGETRYHVNHQLTVKLRDISKTGDILQMAIDSGANQVGSIRFVVSNTEALQAQAREKAMADAKARATQLAEGLGASLGSLQLVSEHQARPTDPYGESRNFDASADSSSVPVSSGSYSVNITINAVFGIE